jgi:hypothetical protein
MTICLTQACIVMVALAPIFGSRHKALAASGHQRCIFAECSGGGSSLVAIVAVFEGFNTPR